MPTGNTRLLWSYFALSSNSNSRCRDSIFTTLHFMERYNYDKSVARWLFGSMKFHWGARLANPNATIRVANPTMMRAAPGKGWNGLVIYKFLKTPTTSSCIHMSQCVYIVSCSTTRGSGSGLSLRGHTKVKARKSFLFTGGSLKVLKERTLVWLYCTTFQALQLFSPVKKRWSLTLTKIYHNLVTKALSC